MRGAHSWEGQSGRVVRDVAENGSVGDGLTGPGAAEQEVPCSDRSLLIGGRGQKNHGDRKTTQLALTPQR